MTSFVVAGIKLQLLSDVLNCTCVIAQRGAFETDIFRISLLLLRRTCNKNIYVIVTIVLIHFSTICRG